MELKVFRDVLPAAGADCTAKAELPLETELLISDYLPPVQRIVKCFAKPVVLQKQLAPGRLTLEGYLRCTVYYQGEEGAGLCQTEQKLPFTKALELPSFAATAWTACVEGQTEYLNCRAVNPRRIEVRGAYGLVVSVHAQLSTEVITALSEGGIEQKPVTLAGVRRAATLEKLVTIEGALTFPKPPAAILDITGTAEVRELKLMQGKAVAKGVLHVLCAWRAEGDAALRSQTADLPFNQILDADGLSEDCRCLCVLEPVGFAAAEGETTEDGAASTTLTATAMLRLSGWRPYQLQCVADAFSTRFETTLTPQTLANSKKEHNRTCRRHITSCNRNSNRSCIKHWNFKLSFYKCFYTLPNIRDCCRKCNACTDWRRHKQFLRATPNNRSNKLIPILIVQCSS